MIRMEIAGQEALERAQKMLSGIPKGVEKAIGTAIKRTASGVRTESTKAILERYDIKASEVRKNEDVHVNDTHDNGIGVEIVFAGKRIPLHRFGGATPKVPSWDTSRRIPVKMGNEWRLYHPGIAATGHQLKSTSPTRFHDAFVAKMKSGHIGIFETTGGETAEGRDEIRELTGSSAPQMLGSEQVSGKLDQITEERFHKEFNQAIEDILNGHF